MKQQMAGLSKTILLLLCSLFIINTYNAHGQGKVIRKELNVDLAASNYYLVPLENQSLLLFFQKEESSERGMNDWKFIKLDSKLKEVWSKEMQVDNALEFGRYYSNDKGVYLLMANINLDQEKNEMKLMDDVFIFSYDLKTENITPFSAELPTKIALNDFTVTNNFAYIGGYKPMAAIGKFTRMCAALCIIPCFIGVLDYDAEPLMYIVDLDKKQMELARLNYEENCEITNIATIGNKKIDASAVMLQRTKKDGTLYVFNYKGQRKKETIKVKTGNDNLLINGSLNELSEEQRILVGTYSDPLEKESFIKRAWRSIGGTSLPLFANGIYFSKFNNRDQKLIKYYDFTDIEGFTKYAAGGERAESRTARGKSSDLSTYILMHKVQKIDDHYVLLGECYIPTYDYYYVHTADGGTRTQQVFDGFLWTHAFVAGFDKDGDMNWTHSFPIATYKSFELRKKVKMTKKGDKLALAYNSAGKINSKVIAGNEVVDEFQSTEIETFEENKDKEVKANYRSGIEPWYENYFVAFGYQKRKKGKGWFSGKERIFYINKIEFK